MALYSVRYKHYITCRQVNNFIYLFMIVRGVFVGARSTSGKSVWEEGSENSKITTILFKYVAV